MDDIWLAGGALTLVTALWAWVGFFKRSDVDGADRKSGETSDSGAGAAAGDGAGAADAGAQDATRQADPARAAAMASNYAELRRGMMRDILLSKAAAASAADPARAAALAYLQQRAAQNPKAGSTIKGAAVISTNWSTAPGSVNYARAAQNLYPPQPPLSPPQLKTDGIVVGEIVAHRVWVCQMGFLRSVFMSEVVWAPHEAQSGVPGNGWGIHAWKTQSQALRYGMVPATGGMVMVYGRVLLWGDVIEHENGYRAEHAKVLVIDGVLPDDAALLGALRAKYDEP